MCFDYIFIEKSISLPKKNAVPVIMREKEPDGSYCDRIVYLSFPEDATVIEKGQPNTTQNSTKPYPCSSNQIQHVPIELEVAEATHPFLDPASWPQHMTNCVRNEIARLGPHQVLLAQYPKDGAKKSRSFSSYHYNGIGAASKRNWLVYSQINDAVFCFCCKLMCENKKALEINALVNQKGFRNWGNLSYTLKTHEKSSLHSENQLKLDMLTLGLTHKNTIDQETQLCNDNEKARFKKVFQRFF